MVIPELPYQGYDLIYRMVRDGTIDLARQPFTVADLQGTRIGSDGLVSRPLRSPQARVSRALEISRIIRDPRDDQVLNLEAVRTHKLHRASA